MTSMDALAGVLHLSPGQPRPHNLRSSRRDWAQVLTQGVPAASLSTRLASLFSLCGHSHRLCADMAVAAALTGQPSEITAAALYSLQQETLREQVRRITLDWPRQLVLDFNASATLQTGQAAQAALLRCPLFAAVPPPEAEIQAALQDWLQTQLLGMPAAQWLDAWEANPSAWLHRWSTATPLWLPQLLFQVQKDGLPLISYATSATILRVNSSVTELMALADTLRQVPDFTRQPLWRGACAETGPWTRLNQTHPEAFNTPLLRLGSRLAELVRLVLPDHPERSGTQWLRMGSLATAHREGLAWVEMARGLLIHHVQLEEHVNSAHVKSCHVLAPTEWNFHPNGAVAQALENWPAGHAASADGARHVNLWVCAYDPCVAHEIVPVHSSATTFTQEPRHA